MPVFRTLGAELWSGGRLVVSRAGSVFDANAEMTDTATRDRVRKFAAGFAAYAEARTN